MSRILKALLLLLVAAAVAGTTGTSASAMSPQDCAVGSLLTQGSVSISFPSSTTAQANPSGWQFCGDAVYGYTYAWSTGSTGPTTGGSAGQAVSVTVAACTYDNGCGVAPAIASATFPGGGSGGGGGGGGSAPAVTLTVLQPNPITAGQSGTLQLATGNSPTSCSSGAGWSNAGKLSGTFSTGIMNTAGSYHYTVSCSNAYGTTTAGTNPDLVVNAVSGGGGGGGGGTVTDSDHDGISDASDNCPNTANANQHDADLNGVGDACQSTFYGLDGSVTQVTQGTSSPVDACSYPNRCFGLALTEQCATFSATVSRSELITHRILFKQRFGEDLCWIPGRFFTREKAGSKFTTDLTNTFDTYPWTASVRQGVTASLVGNQASLYAQWDEAECPVLLLQSCTFHFYPWAREHWVVPSVRNYPPTFLYFESGF